MNLKFIKLHTARITLQTKRKIRNVYTIVHWIHFQRMFSNRRTTSSTTEGKKKVWHSFTLLYLINIMTLLRVDMAKANRVFIFPFSLGFVVSWFSSECTVDFDVDCSAFNRCRWISITESYMKIGRRSPKIPLHPIFKSNICISISFSCVLSQSNTSSSKWRFWPKTQKHENKMKLYIYVMCLFGGKQKEEKRKIEIS